MYTLLFLALTPASGGWGGGSCSGGSCAPPAPAAVVAVDKTLRWKKSGDRSLALYQGEYQIGHFDYDKQEYRPLVDYGLRTFGAPTPLPLALPDEWVRVGAGEAWKYDGVNGSKVNPSPTYACNGKACSRAHVFASIQGSDLPDDSAKSVLTVIGSTQTDADAKMKAITSAPTFAPLKDKYHVVGFGKDSPMLACGFITEPDTVYVQNAKGEVLHRGVYTSAETVIEAARKARPDYDPKKDADLNRVLPSLPLLAIEAFVKEHMLTLIIIGVVLFLLFRKQS